jgi:hypothetical protein
MNLLNPKHVGQDYRLGLFEDLSLSVSGFITQRDFFCIKKELSCFSKYKILVAQIKTVVYKTLKTLDFGLEFL